MNKNILVAILIILIILAGAYFALANKPVEETNNELLIETNQMPVVTSGENPQPGSTVHDLPVEPAAAAARKDLAAKLSVNEKSIVIMNISNATWNDGCLGLGKSDEMCSQALVPGFKVEMLAQGKTYIYRTDKTGGNIRAEENI